MPERAPRRVGLVLFLGLAVVVGLVAVIAAAADRAGDTGRATQPVTSLRADESGHRAARLLLERLGMTARSRRRARLPEGTGHVLIHVEAMPGAPQPELPEAERAAIGSELASWVERGNAVLVLGSRQVHGTGWPKIRDRLEADVDPLIAGPTPLAGAPNLDALFGERPGVPVDGGDLVETHDVPGLQDPWVTPYYVVEPGGADDVLVARPGAEAEPVVVVSRRAAGHVVSVADPWFATNARIARGDNAAWLATLVWRVHGGGDVLFDDRALGQVATRGVLSMLQEQGLGPALAAGLLLVLLVWWRVGPSDAPERRVGERQEYRPEAYAELRRDLYASCLGAEDIRRVVAYEVARRLGRGDTATPERAVRLLAVRDPQRAADVRAAVGALPAADVAPPAEHPRLWVQAVSRVWSALGTPRSATETNDQETDDGLDG